MAEALAKKKRIRTGHKASATQILCQIKEISFQESPNTSKLSLLTMSLRENSEIWNNYNEIVELIDDDTLSDKIK